ncbi:MAG TPA: transposase [Blastocatellia bacterium]|nr:transposase [Blastocatellia bacterium]
MAEPQQRSLRNLDTAFTNFFEKRAPYPKFKSRRHRQSVRYGANAFTFRDGRIILAKQSEPLDFVWSRLLPDDAKILNLTISRDTSGSYFASILVETEIKPLRKIRAEVGIEVGIKTLATCGVRHDRDHNAAKKVRNEGVRILVAVGHTETLNACGASVRPATAGRSR